MSPRLKILFESTTYYPYGEPTTEPRGQRFLFGGKEREHAAGRNTYDFGARNLAANAWTTPDPLAEKFYPLSPYSYCGGDPINYVDPDGKEKKCLSKDENDIAAMNVVKDDSRIHLFAHGTSQSITVGVDDFGKPIRINSLDDFVKVINENFESVTDIREMAGVEIVLHSCWTAYSKNGEKPIAQKLSEGLKDVFITAPSGGVSVMSSGMEILYQKNPDESKVHTIDAKWNTYFRGQQISQEYIFLIKLILKAQKLSIFKL